MREDEATSDDLVVLIHGFGSNRLVMWPLASRLRQQGFRVHQWTYPSLFRSIQIHAARLSNYLMGSVASERRVHIVAHSMGCIVARAALNVAQPDNLGRVVLLAPPNLGSPVAGMASKLVGSLVIPCVELSDAPTSFVNQLENLCTSEIGILAATHDFLIPHTNTQLPGQLQHETIPGTHSSMLWTKVLPSKVGSFLRSGHF